VIHLETDRSDRGLVHIETLENVPNKQEFDHSFVMEDRPSMEISSPLNRKKSQKFDPFVRNFPKIQIFNQVLSSTQRLNPTFLNQFVVATFTQSALLTLSPILRQRRNWNI
jgi:hypothetical protein